MEKPSHYYVPHQSAWPILGALALLVLALGSLNLNEKWGLIALLLGLVTLLFMIFGWIGSVIKESDAGLYSLQMDKTFRWGMFWFLITELFLFGLLLVSILHVRFSIIAWLAGQSGDTSALTHYLLWPDFSSQWPLTTPPLASPAKTSANQFISMRGVPFTNLILLLASAGISILSPFYLKKNQYAKTFKQLTIALLLGILCFGLQTYYLTYLIKANLIIKTGIYGSLVVAFLSLHLINMLAALLFLIGISIRLHQGKITSQNTFSLDAGIWWWVFLAGMWLLGFILIF